VVVFVVVLQQEGKQSEAKKGQQMNWKGAKMMAAAAAWAHHAVAAASL